MGDDRYDVVVVGGGPAGAMAALTAAGEKASVLLIDRKRRFGERPHCAEYVPRALALEVDFPKRSIVQPVEAMETYVAGDRVTTPAPGYVLDRSVFDHGLVLAAIAAGARAEAGSRLVGLENGTCRIVRAGREMSVRAKAVVAADGAGGSVRRLLGMQGPKRLTGLQLEVPLSGALDRTRIYFDRAWRHGYAWLFPKGKTANLGLGMKERAPGQAAAALEDFRQSLVGEGLIREGIAGRTGGAIMAGGMADVFHLGQVVFAGDAAGLTHAVTGAGIPQAIFSGALAGRAAARLAFENDEKAPTEYEREIRLRYGRSLTHALGKRAVMEADWETGDFAGLIRRTWPAFREYRR